jgi:GalNAc-alpha-(1->4)-GalNAc-alpha-(1->3)-diNAcBac-PP-undecaprenol alpha-1,4-N-acetyl-D-galactosaminyltransferase
MDSEAVRIAFVIWDMREGGAQRVMAILANHWAARAWHIDLFTLDPPARESVYHLAAEVERHPLEAVAPGRARGLGRLSTSATGRLRRALRAAQPDVVVSFLPGPNLRALAATLGLGIPVIVNDHCDPHVRPLPRSREVLRRLLYPGAAAVVAVTETAMAFYPPAVRARGCVIANPVLAPPPAGPGCPAPGTNRAVVSMGRLHEVKGFERLIAAFACVAPDHPEWSLVIWGDGEARPSLEAEVRRLGLAGRVHLPGRTDCPADALRRGDIFAMSSRTEGFPVALCEAMACGLPAVSFDCPSGPRHVVRDGVDGVLVPDGDVPALGAALDRLMTDEGERRRLASRAPDVLARFGADSVIARWEQLVRAVARQRGAAGGGSACGMGRPTAGGGQRK